MSSLPDPPPIHLLPPAVRSAERLHGSLVPCGPGFRPVGWPNTPRIRAAALTGHCAPNTTAVLDVAAWVWGTRRAPSYPLDIARKGGGTATERFNPMLRVHDLHFRTGEVIAFGKIRVSTPQRTLYDLLRLKSEFSAIERASCRLLLQLVPGGVATIIERISTHASPHRKRALARLAGLHARERA
jgi:hypothetical protein